MTKFTKSQKQLVLENYHFLIKEISKLAQTKGIIDISFEGFIIKPTGDTLTQLNCKCGTETYIDPRTGKVSVRCKKCPG